MANSHNERGLGLVSRLGDQVGRATSFYTESELRLIVARSQVAGNSSKQPFN